MILESTIEGMHATAFLKAKNRPARQEASNHNRCYRQQPKTLALVGTSNVHVVDAGTICAGMIGTECIESSRLATLTVFGDYVTDVNIASAARNNGAHLWWAPWAPIRNASGTVERLLDEVQSLRDGWDGPGSVAPNASIKLAVTSVVGQISAFLAFAEVEIDPTEGTVVFRWFTEKQNTLISLTLLRSGSAVAVKATADADDQMHKIRAGALSHVGRVLIDLGLGDLRASLR